jgi:uncharacterized protein YjbJ (UPF0337 family)
MDREHVKGAADKAKGKHQGNGRKLDKAKGDIHNAVGNVKDAAAN